MHHLLIDFTKRDGGYRYFFFHSRTVISGRAYRCIGSYPHTDFKVIFTLCDIHMELYAGFLRTCILQLTHILWIYFGYSLSALILYADTEIVFHPAS